MGKRHSSQYANFGSLQTSASDNNPVANPEAVVICGKARFTVLTPEMIRIEYSAKGIFEDQATFTVTNRRLKVPRGKNNNEFCFLLLFFVLNLN